MSLLQVLDHLINFVLPALALGLIMAGPVRTWLTRSDTRPGFWVNCIAQVALGIAVLAAGLAWFGRDGKMATYAGLVVGAGTLQWLMQRGWRP